MLFLDIILLMNGVVTFHSASGTIFRFVSDSHVILFKFEIIQFGDVLFE